MEHGIPLREKSFGWAQIVVGGLGIAYLLFCFWKLIHYVSVGGPVDDDGVHIVLKVMLMFSPSILVFILGVATVKDAKWARIVNGVLIPLAVLGWGGYLVSTCVSYGILCVMQKIASAFVFALIPVLCFHWPKKLLRRIAWVLLLSSAMFLAGHFAFGV